MRTLALMLVALASSVCVPALADEAAPTATAPRQALIVRVDVGTSGLSADVIRTAIGTELGVETVAEGDTGGALSVRVVGVRVRVSFVRSSGEKLEREVELPREASSRIEVIALLAGNLARDEAAALLAALKKPPTETAPEAAQVSEPATQEKPAKVPPPPPPRPKPSNASGDDEVRAPVAPEQRPPLTANLSLFHPVAVVGDSERHSFGFELGLAYSRIGGLSGFGLTIGHLRVRGPAKGVGVSGLWTRVDGDSEGAFGSGIFSQGGGALSGAEGAGIATLRSGNVDGFQGSGVVGTAARVRGAQLAGAVSWANGPVLGAQAAAGLSFARGDVDGAQLALVNIGGNVRGAQLGLVNIGGDVRGSQVGLVNVSDRIDGVPLGVVNVVKHGRTQAVAWADTLVVANAAVKYLNGPVYTLLGAGYDGGDGAAAAFALGAQIRVSRSAYVEVDALYRYLSDFDDTDTDPDRHLSAARVVLGLDRLGPAGLFAGGGVSHDIDSHGNDARVRAYGVAGATLF